MCCPHLYPSDLYFIINPHNKRGVYCFSSIHPSICSFIRNKYIHHIFLRNYWWQPHDLWCAASARGSILHLPFHTCTYINFWHFWNFVIFFVTFFSGSTDDSHIMVFCMQPQLGILYHAYLFRICSTPIFC